MDNTPDSLHPTPDPQPTPEPSLDTSKTNIPKAVVTDPEHHSPAWLTAGVKYLTYIGAPAGVVAALCSAMSVSGPITGFTTLVSMALVSLCVFRQKIRDHVPSPILLFVILSMIVVFFMNYQTILLKDTGLLRYYKQSSELQPDLAESLKTAKSQVTCFGTNFYISPTDQHKEITKCLNRGVTVRYLVVDPYSPFLARMAKDFNQQFSDLQAECRKSLSSLLALRKEWKEDVEKRGTAGQLEIRFFDSTPRMRAYFIDPREGTGHSYVVPYINGVNSPELPAFKFQNIDTGVYLDYYEGVQKVWNSAMPVDKFLELHKDAEK